jgi:hypothetical protein
MILIGAPVAAILRRPEQLPDPCLDVALGAERCSFG